MPSAPARHISGTRFSQKLVSYCALNLVLAVASAFAQGTSSSSLPEAPEPHTDVPAPPPSQQFITIQSQAMKAPEPVTLTGLPKNILLDQKAIWTSPLRIKPADAEWLIPLGVSTVMLIESDPHTMNHAIDVATGKQTTANNISNASVIALGAIPAAGYLWGV